MPVQIPGVHVASQRQSALMRELAEERLLAEIDKERLLNKLDQGRISFEQARTEVIPWLLRQSVRPGVVPSRIRAMPKKPQLSEKDAAQLHARAEARNLTPATRAVRRDPATLLTSGVFRLDGEIYVIVPIRNGHHIAKRLVHSPKRLAQSGDVVEFDYVDAPGVIWALEEQHRLPVDEIESMLIRYGRCIYPGCNVKLKDPRSVKAGVGKRHAQRLGIPWGGKKR